MERARWAARIIGVLILLLSVFTPREIYKLAKDYRKRWGFRRQWRQVALIAGNCFILVAGVILVIGYGLWIAWAALGTSSLFVASTPCSSLKWRRTRTRRIVRNAFFYITALWLFSIAYTSKKTGA